MSSTLDLSVGYMNGNSKVTIHSPSDVDDVWKMTTSSKGEAVNLWCDKTVKRDKESSESESEQRGLYNLGQRRSSFLHSRKE